MGGGSVCLRSGASGFERWVVEFRALELVAPRSGTVHVSKWLEGYETWSGADQRM